MSITNKEFLHGLQEYSEFKTESSVAQNVKSFLDILYAEDQKSAFVNHFLPKDLANIYGSDNFEQDLIVYLLNNYEGNDTRYFRFIKDFIKKDKDMNILSDALSRSQIKSKIWLVNELEKISNHYGNVVLLAGWYGQLVELFGDSVDKITFKKFRNVEIDIDACNESDYNFNLRRMDDYKVKSIHGDINNLNLHGSGYQWDVENFKSEEKYNEQFYPDLIINTSAEHMTTEWFNQIRFNPWKDHKPIVAIQSNNYFDLEEHVNCVHSINHMKKIFPMSKILYEGELQLKGYKRVMLIGEA